MKFKLPRSLGIGKRHRWDGHSFPFKTQPILGMYDNFKPMIKIFKGLTVRVYCPMSE